MSLQEQLIKIQSELKAPKGQKNNFGNYKYRNCEDILEAVKPLLKKYDCIMIISDEIVLIGDRYYVKASATIHHVDVNISSFGYAREALSKKGMDESQITGAASSYARKYALNGLFLIDDTKDADSQEPVKEAKKAAPKPAPKKKKTLDEMIDQVFEDPNEKRVDALLDYLEDQKAPAKTMDHFKRLNAPFLVELAKMKQALETVTK